MIPAVPQGDTVGPLVSIDDYVRETQDTAAVNAGQVTPDTLAEAAEMVQVHTFRTLGYATYTERLFVNRLGMVYPSAVPIDPNPALLITPDTAIQQGDSGLWVGYYTPLPSLPVWTDVVPPQTDVTYNGGFQPYGATGGPTPALPAKLMRAVVKVAWFLAHPVMLAGLPGGAKSVSLGGVSVSGDLSSMVAGDPELGHVLRSYRRQHAHAWDQ